MSEIVFIIDRKALLNNSDFQQKVINLDKEIKPHTTHLASKELLETVLNMHKNDKICVSGFDESDFSKEENIQHIRTV